MKQTRPATPTPTPTPTPTTLVLHRARGLLLAVTLLVAGSAGKIALAAAPSTSAIALGTIHRAANDDLRSMKSRCQIPVQDDATDLEAQAVYGRSAQNIAWVVRDYPYPADEDGALDRSDHTLLAVTAYERAFNCEPLLANRHYIEDALDLIAFRLKLASESEQRDRGAEDLLPLTAAESRLRNRLRGLPPACKTAAPPTCPIPEVVADDPPDETPSSRLRRALDSFALGIEVGTGISNSDNQDRRALFALAISPSYRFVLGKSDHHRVHLGFLYGLQAGNYDDVTPYITSALTAQLGYAIADKTGRLAVHASLGAGFVQTRRFSFQSVINPGLGLCMIDDILCLHGRGFLRLQGSENTIRRDFWTIALGIDMIRLSTHKPREKSDRQ